VEVPSRNRSVLIGVVRELQSPLATRFELRAPNPGTNTYIAVGALYMAMLDGIKYALENGKTEDDLLAELSKKHGDTADYLEKDRAYRSEIDVFGEYTDEQREDLYGKAPATVYENLSALEEYPEKKAVLTNGGILKDKFIESFKEAFLEKWTVEIEHRILNQYSNEIRNFKQLHHSDKALDIDLANWAKVNELRYALLKNSYSQKSLFTQIKEAVESKEYAKASDLQVIIEKKIAELRQSYSTYKKNLLDL
ncbi:glutamine synthetase, partial [Clostridium tyrobutyricum]|nr:glutamine synthetase [Clostridium tyrobutyricum]